MARRISLVDISGRRRRTRRLLFWSGIVIGCALLICGMIWVVARSAVFRIREVRVEGAQYVSAADVTAFLNAHVAQGRVSRFFGNRNLLAWPEGFSGSELGSLPAVTGLDIKKSYLHRTVTVGVTERTRVGQWCFEKDGPPQCFWFDANGVLFMRGYPSEGNLIPALHDHSRGPLALGDTVLPQRFLPNLLSIFKALQAMDLSVRELRLDDLSLEEVRATTYEGPELLFSLRLSAAAAAEAIMALRRMTPLSGLEYIDFRVENKVYYK